MATKFTGKNGSATFYFDGGGSADIEMLIRWTIRARVELHQITPLSSSNGNHEYSVGFSDWSARVRGYVDENGLDVQEGDVGSLEIQTGDASKPSYSGQAICEAAIKQGDVRGFVVVDYLFIGNGYLIKS